jgi:hypothetical protein
MKAVCRCLIPDFASDRPELEPKTIHHFDSGVSLFWTDFDSYE